MNKKRLTFCFKLRQQIQTSGRHIVSKKFSERLTLKDVENDPLENKVFGENDELLASRDWKCQAQNCSYIFYRANAQTLKIKVRSEDSKNLVGTNHVCLKHYYVDGKKRMTVIIILN